MRRIWWRNDAVPTRRTVAICRWLSTNKTTKRFSRCGTRIRLLAFRGLAFTVRTETVASGRTISSLMRTTLFKMAVGVNNYLVSMLSWPWVNEWLFIIFLEPILTIGNCVAYGSPRKADDLSRYWVSSSCDDTKVVICETERAFSVLILICAIKIFCSY